MEADWEYTMCVCVCVWWGVVMEIRLSINLAHQWINIELALSFFLVFFFIAIRQQMTCNFVSFFKPYSNHIRTMGGC